MPYLALIYNTETLEVFKISSVISREPSGLLWEK